VSVVALELEPVVEPLVSLVVEPLVPAVPVGPLTPAAPVAEPLVVLGEEDDAELRSLFHGMSLQAPSAKTIAMAAERVSAFMEVPFSGKTPERGSRKKAKVGANAQFGSHLFR